jgi:DNA-binding transcriptional ArsR family regulator
MVEEMTLNSVFHALSHETRREMLGRLSEGDLTIGELAEPLTMSLAAASKHVKVLESAGLVRRSVAGRRHVCRLTADAMASASAWMRHYEQFWEARLDALESLLKNPDTGKKEKR